MTRRRRDAMGEVEAGDDGSSALASRGPGGDSEMAGRAHEGPREREPETAAVAQAESIIHPLRARVRARLDQLGHDDEGVRFDARVLLCWAIQADGCYVSKVTPKEIAEVLAEELGPDHPGAVKWTTVEQNGCEAERHRRRMDRHPEEIARYQLRAEAHTRRVLRASEEMLAEIDEVEVEGPLDAKLKSEALARAFEPAEKVLEREAKTLGLIQTGSTPVVSITIGGEAFKAPLDEAQRWMTATAAFFAERHPELAEEYRAFLMGEAT